MNYELIKKILFYLPPELSHNLALNIIALGLLTNSVPDAPRSLMGLNFKNPLGLAAGFDKNGNALHGLAKLGFGFIEVGTVTPKPQRGNPKPRLFRIPEYEAIINRLGFNNNGVDALVKRLKHRPDNVIIGVNIGKNRDTSLEKSYNDYTECYYKVYNYADYVTVNISSPNTPGLRDLQHEKYLDKLLGCLKKQQKSLTKRYDKYVPLALKIAPDINEYEINTIAELLILHKIDAVVATNTTISRPENFIINEQGGLSGKPLAGISDSVVSALAKMLHDKIPIIGVGGIIDSKTANNKLANGANLLQVYSGLIYKGPDLINEIITKLED